MRAQFVGAVIIPVLAVTTASLARAAMTSEELAKLAQNPVGDVISVPFQNNTNFHFGPEEETQNVLDIQPVIPVSIGADWNVITRTILPVIHMPRLGSTVSSQDGIGDTTFTAFLSPSQPKGVIWGVGPVIQIPTHNNEELGNDNWGGGASFVVLELEKGSPWVFGMLVNNVWSLTDDQDGGSYNVGLIQPFINYNFKGGAYLTTAPIATVDWDASSDDKRRCS